MEKPILTILIPTYQGSQHLHETVASVLPQLDSRIEFLICDDGSRDSTPSILEKLARENPKIKIELFPENFGMDRHFIRAVKKANGAFIWVLGQDDVLRPGAVTKAIELITLNPNLGFIYFNFSQNSHDLSRVLGESLLDEASLLGKVEYGKEYLFNSPEQYFKSFNAAPYFCSSKVFRTEYWFQPDIAKYAGTHFIMPAMLLLNMRKHSSAVVTTPMVTGRIPDNKWQANGQSLFEVTVGYLEMREMIYRDSRNPFPSELHKAFRRDFLKKFFPLVRASKKKGMQPKAEILAKLRFVFNDGFIYHFYLKPIFWMPLHFLDSISRLAYFPKRLLFRT
jgi:glycosyltransferase involved in cell wall biosynthesis